MSIRDLQISIENEADLQENSDQFDLNMNLVTIDGLDG